MRIAKLALVNMRDTTPWVTKNQYPVPSENVEGLPINHSLKIIIRDKVRPEVRECTHRHVSNYLFNQIWDAVSEGIWQQMLIVEDIEAVY